MHMNVKNKLYKNQYTPFGVQNLNNKFMLRLQTIKLDSNNFKSMN